MNDDENNIIKYYKILKNIIKYFNVFLLIFNNQSFKIIEYFVINILN
jgi:hypothetical protein